MKRRKLHLVHIKLSEHMVCPILRIAINMEVVFENWNVYILNGRELNFFCKIELPSYRLVVTKTELDSGSK